jgi:hypothetical protein
MVGGNHVPPTAQTPTGDGGRGDAKSEISWVVAQLVERSTVQWTLPRETEVENLGEFGETSRVMAVAIPSRAERRP